VFCDQSSKVCDELIEVSELVWQFEIVNMYVRPFGVMVIHKNLFASCLINTNQTPLQAIFIAGRSGDLMN
jgi:hypothetical protein